MENFASLTPLSTMSTSNSSVLDLNALSAQNLKDEMALGHAISMLESLTHTSAESVCGLLEDLCSVQNLFEFILSGEFRLACQLCPCHLIYLLQPSNNGLLKN